MFSTMTKVEMSQFTESYCTGNAKCYVCTYNCFILHLLMIKTTSQLV